MTSVLDIPGYAEAIAKERFLRDAAFLGVTETVAGFELKPFTLRNFITLRLARNPLIYGKLPTPVQLAQFLWTASDEYSRCQKARASFMRRCRKFNPKPPLLFETKRWRRRHLKTIRRFLSAVRSVRAYLKESSMDRPPEKMGGGWRPDYYSEIVFWMSLFEFRYTADQVLDMPMKVLYQCYQAAKESKDPKATLFNPSDKVRAEFTSSSNRN